ncbi:dephospho-CoA kinase [Arachidicoccus ginsenosidimutans]|uniref:dephospho-CoA kinase n=1 Tax=Arachidicoccus sp. BS20 TaxID=1850526 RepID=UPI0007F09A4C|nr:dephospho-CoA kinase [Arachidicoccus sp. BS20]ANI88815.1 dephospho-CoA kinase [Arachidicoccus sp. BS20]
MLRIGITGGIGSGKSTVAHIFHTFGIPVFDADSAAKNIMQGDKNVHAALVKNFGKEVFENGTLNRKYLSAVVFNDEEKLKTLNAIVHPATIRAADEWMEKQKTPYVLKEAALLFEAGTVAGLDAIIGVYAPLELRVHRVMQRSNLSRKEVMERVVKQMDEDEKMSLCDYVVVNDEQQLLVPQVLLLHERFSST